MANENLQLQAVYTSAFPKATRCENEPPHAAGLVMQDATLQIKRETKSVEMVGYHLFAMSADPFGRKAVTKASKGGMAICC